MIDTNEAIQKRYKDALDSFVDKVEKDRNIVAAIVSGSLAYDQVWEKSDIDLMLIAQDGVKINSGSQCFVEDGIDIHASITLRNEFKRRIEGALGSSFEHSYFSKSKLLFSKDETIAEYYKDVHRIGARDKEIQLLRAGADVLPSLAKAEKWYYVKNDLNYSFLWLMYVINGLATIEVIMNDEITGREVIHQAIKHNPNFFNAVYTDFINKEKDDAAVKGVLDMVNQYLDEKIDLLFKPILDHLTEASGVRTTTELNEHFRKMQVDGLVAAYEWLAQKGIIQKVSAPYRLTKTSRVEVEEAAYYYDSEDDLVW